MSNWALADAPTPYPNSAALARSIAAISGAGYTPTSVIPPAAPPASAAAAKSA